jgi:methanol metabolism-related c-type cytochrome
MYTGEFARPVALALALAVSSTAAMAAEKYEADGKWLTKEDDTITYNIKEDGKVDWYTYSGFRRYHSECHVCHGPDGLGSTYAPALSDSMQEMDYYTFAEVVMSGRERKLADGSVSVMPALGDNTNVACYVEDLYAYLSARADGAIGRGRPKARDPKPEGAKEAESACHQ